MTLRNLNTLSYRTYWHFYCQLIFLLGTYRNKIFVITLTINFSDTPLESPYQIKKEKKTFLRTHYVRSSQHQYGSVRVKIIFLFQNILQNLYEWQINQKNKKINIGSSNLRYVRKLECPTTGSFNNHKPGRHVRLARESFGAKITSEVERANVVFVIWNHYGSWTPPLLIIKLFQLYYVV